MLEQTISTADDAGVPTVLPRRLKIALLGYRSNPYSGGQGVYLHYLSKALLKAGHHVDVISGPPYPVLVDGVNLIKLPSLDLFAADNHTTALRPRHLLSLSDTFEYLSMLTGGFPEPYTFGRRLKQYFRTHRPDYDIVHDNQSLCYGALWLQQQGIPLVTTIHHPITSDLTLALESADSWGLRLLIKRWHHFIRMQKQVAAGLNHIITVSESSRVDIISAFNLEPDKVTVIHNGIDTGTFRPMADVVRRPFELMATASADQPLKGLAYLVTAIAGLVERYPEIHLTVLGKLNEDGPTEKLIRSFGLQSRIRFVSGVETDVVVRMYAEATIVVVPSLYEGFGFPAGEAMACGVPVISTSGGALPEVVGDAGIIVPTHDSDSIARAVSQLLDDPDERERLAHAGRERICERFSWDVAASALANHYQNVINQTNC